MILYNLKTSLGDQFTITKFDDDMNVESSYSVSETGCACPQGHKPTCRHRKMLPAILEIVDTEAFYCYDNRKFYNANGEEFNKPAPQAGKMDFETVRDIADEILAQQAQPVPIPTPTPAPATTTFRRRV